MIRSRLLIAATVVVCMSFATSARAALLDLTPGMLPDIFSQSIFVDYNATTQEFTATGFAMTITPPAGTQENFDQAGSFSISAIIDNSGNLVSGSITILGEWSGFGPTLLTGDLTAFGFTPSGGQLFEFVFDVTGGDLSGPGYYGDTGVFGVILGATGVNFTGDWNVNFTNSGDFIGGTADTFPIPGPGAGFLFLLAGCIGRRRRR